MTNGEVDGPPMSARGSEPPHTKCAAVRHTLDFNCDNVFSIRRSGVIFGVSEGGSCHCNRGRGRCDRSGQILKKSTAAGCQWPLRHQMRRGYRLPMGQEKILRSAFAADGSGGSGLQCAAHRTTGGMGPATSGLVTLGSHASSCATAMCKPSAPLPKPPRPMRSP